MKIPFTIWVLFWLIVPFDSNAQIFTRIKSTKPESECRHISKYSEYWDSDSSRISARGYFSQGRPVKTWKYYYASGTRRMKVKYHKKLKIKYYSPNGRLDMKGYALLDINSQLTHFYWDGLWKYYNPKRKLYRIALYKNGEEIKVLYGPEDPVYYGE